MLQGIGGVPYTCVPQSSLLIIRKFLLAILEKRLLFHMNYSYNFCCSRVLWSYFSAKIIITLLNIIFIGILKRRQKSYSC